MVVDLTDLEAEKVFACIRFIANNYEIKALKLKIEYDSLNIYNDELAKEIEKNKMLDNYYTTLSNKFKK